MGLVFIQIQSQQQSAWLKIRKTYDPNQDTIGLYNHLYHDVYVKIYKRLSDLTDVISHITTHLEDDVKEETIG